MGRFCHIFIPNYVYVPPEVLQEYGLDIDLRSVEFSVVWRRLYRARTLACTTVTDTIDLSDVMAQLRHDVPWIQILRSNNVQKTFPFDDLDVLQYATAAQRGFRELHSLTNRQIYDCFIRPLERLVAIDMPLTNRLRWAFTCKDETDDLVTILLQLAGLPDTPVGLSSRFMIEELSKIRALRSADFRRQDPLDSPKVTHPYVRLSPGPMREYEPDTDRDALRQLGIDPPNRPLLGPHGEDHRHQCEAINDQILDTIASQQPLAADRQKLTVMLQSGVPQPQERHKRYKYVCAQLRRKKTQLTNLWDEYEAVLERRTGQHFLGVQQDRSAKQIQDLFSLPRIEVKMQLVQWRSTRTDLLKERHTLHSYLSGISQAANKEPMELADVPLRQSLLAKRAGIDRQTEDLKHRLAEGDRILEGKRQHDGPCSQLENLVLSGPSNFVLGDRTGVPPQTRIRTALQNTVTGDSYFMCQPSTQADTPSTPSSIGGTSFPSAPPSTSDNSEGIQKF
jgi:hypothetical protein